MCKGDDNANSFFHAAKENIRKIIDIRRELGDVDSALLRALNETLNDGRTCEYFIIYA